MKKKKDNFLDRFNRKNRTVNPLQSFSLEEISESCQTLTIYELAEKYTCSLKQIQNYISSYRLRNGRKGKRKRKQ